MRITRYSRTRGGDYYQRGAAKPYRRRGAHNGPIPFRDYTGHSQPAAYSPYHGSGQERRYRGGPSPSDDRLPSVPRDRPAERASRERYRTDDYSRHSVSRDRSLSSVLSDISSGSSCFGTVRASEAYGSPAYEDLTDEDKRGSVDEMTDSSMALSLAPPPVPKHKKRKKDKRKKEKARERERKRAKKDRRRQKEILEERICPPEHDVAQSKEIFASGQNILVSVSFIDNEKGGKERGDRHKKSKRKKAKREKTRDKLIVTKEERASDAAASGRTPRRNSSPSPDSRELETKDVKEKYNLKQQQPAQSEQEKKGQEHDPKQLQQQQQADKHQSTALQSADPKPPATKKKKLDPGVKPVMVIDLERSPGGQIISSPREVIVLSDEEGKRSMVQRPGKEEAKANEADQSNRGPNTPPEPAPKSPDSYDPFEPTKSSPSTAISRHDMGSISSLSFLDHHTHHHQDDQQKEAKGDYHHHSQGHHPHHHHHHHHHHPHHPHHGHHHGHHGQMGSGQDRSMAQPDPTGSSDGVLDLHPDSPPYDKMNALNSSPARTATTSHPYHHLHHPSPMKAIIKSMPKKLLAAGGGREARSHGTAGKANAATAGGQPSGGGTTSGGATTSGGVPFEDELNDGDISPYSPRSSDCDEQMFEPPSHDGNGETQTIALTVDNLRKVFGNDPKTLYGDLRKSYQHRSVIAVDEMYKPHKMTLEMLDEIPDSAVDMQVKEKLIKKLQRQERIVEEVKHCLKPHFNKKRIDKDEYKEIMRKSIPKICHSRSGEINPAKIQALITAYVKKAIAKRRLMGGEGSASGTPLVNPGSYGMPAGTATATATSIPPVMLMNR